MTALIFYFFCGFCGGPTHGLTATLTCCAPAACVKRYSPGRNSERRDKYIYDAGICRWGLWRSAPSPPIVPSPPSTRPVFHHSPSLYSRQGPGPGGARSGEAAQPLQPPVIPRLYAMITIGRSTALASPRSSICMVRRRYRTNSSPPAAWVKGAFAWASFQVRRPAGSGSAMPPLLPAADPLYDRSRPPTWSRRVGEFCSALPLCLSPLALLRLADSMCVR
ncbi:hypothetical protein EDB84DRAFT_561913 [Lactarius hengduanensis]|nr:hypothetical protein EDB84DRAFT_561913 [Lactarius hengduanensis]